MNLNTKMVELLAEIRHTEPIWKSRKLSVPESELGNTLIQFYYRTSNLKTRELITEFMSHAGFIWLKKLITKDTSPLAQVQYLSSLDEYTALAAANDPSTQWVSSAG